MKKLFFIILIITLPVIGFFQYKNYRRFHPPVKYDFIVSDSIDLNYHDQDLVDEYYSKAIEIGSFARLQWSNNGVDVRFPNEHSIQEMNAANYYNRLISRINYLESLLSQSARLKTDGFSDAEVKLIEAGYNKSDIKWIGIKDKLISIVFGEQSEFVWQVQKQLINKGYDHALDGLFGLDTQNAILSFQQDHKVYTSGTITEETFSLLFLK